MASRSAAFAVIAILAIVAVIAAVLLPGGDSGSEGEAIERDQLEFDTSGWKTDFAKHSVPLSEFQSGGPPRDGIPPIDEPRPTSQADAEEWLSEREPVLAVEVGPDVRAYPIQILVWHEIVND